MSDTPWFMPKSHGYGASPANWKGWLAVAAFIALQLALALALMIIPAEQAALTETGIAIWVAAMLAASVAFTWLCRWKTAGDWRWRWSSSPGR